MPPPALFPVNVTFPGGSSATKEEVKEEEEEEVGQPAGGDARDDVDARDAVAARNGSRDDAHVDDAHDARHDDASRHDDARGVLVATANTRDSDGDDAGYDGGYAAGGYGVRNDASWNDVYDDATAAFRVSGRPWARHRQATGKWAIRQETGAAAGERHDVHGCRVWFAGQAGSLQCEQGRGGGARSRPAPSTGA